MSWVCGDCGTRYKNKVEYCTKPWLDRAHLIVWSQAYGVRKSIEVQREVYPIYFETVEALKDFA